MWLSVPRAAGGGNEKRGSLVPTQSPDSQGTQDRLSTSFSPVSLSLCSMMSCTWIAAFNHR